MVRLMQKIIIVIVACCAILVVLLSGCRKAEQQETKLKSFPPNVPQGLTYENIAVILQDMQRYQEAVKKLDSKRIQAIEDRYRRTLFGIQETPLLTYVYPDPPYSRIVLMMMPKDSKTGADWIYNYDKPLPVIHSKSVEIKIRDKDPNNPLVCLLKVPDTTAYMNEYEQESHKYFVRFYVRKHFSGSGTFDFDAMTIPSYRPHGVPFIVFDLDRAQLTDQTVQKTIDCRQ